MKRQFLIVLMAVVFTLSVCIIANAQDKKSFTLNTENGDITIEYHDGKTLTEDEKKILEKQFSTIIHNHLQHENVINALLRDEINRLIGQFADANKSSYMMSIERKPSTQPNKEPMKMEK